MKEYNSEEYSKYKISLLPHRGDLRLCIEAKTLSQLFQGGFRALGNMLRDHICDSISKYDLVQEIEIESEDITVLLIDFLSEVLTNSYCENTVYCQLQILDLQPNYLKARIKGIKTDEFDEDIKAVTYHNAQVHQNPSGNWQTEIIMDL